MSAVAARVLVAVVVARVRATVPVVAIARVPVTARVVVTVPVAAGALVVAEAVPVATASSGYNQYHSN